MHSPDTLIPIAEAEEHRYLAYVTERLLAALQRVDSRLKRHANEIQEQKSYLWDHKADMDHVEKVFTRQVIAQSIMTGGRFATSEDAFASSCSPPTLAASTSLRRTPPNRRPCTSGSIISVTMPTRRRSCTTGGPRSRRCSMTTRSVLRATKRHRATSADTSA